LRQVSPLFDRYVYEALSLEQVVNARNSYGGTAPTQVRQQLQRAKEALAP